jgi:hypothetical protein
MPLTKIQSLGITDGTIVNADINASAAIAGTKLTGVGKVLQVVTATDSTQRSTTSGTFVTGSNTLSVSITPSSASNKIFVISSFDGGSSSQAFYTIYRGASNLATNAFTELYAGGSTQIQGTVSMAILDSPSTTSSTTYQVYFRAASGTAYVNTNSNFGQITAFEIAG